MFQIKHHLVFCWKSFQNLRTRTLKWGLIKPTKGCKLTPVGIRPWSEKCFQHSTIIQIGKSCTSTGKRNKRHVWPELYVVPPRLTARPWKMMVGRRSSPFGMVYKFSRASIAARLNFEGGIPLKIDMQPKTSPNWKAKSSSKPPILGSMFIFMGLDTKLCHWRLSSGLSPAAMMEQRDIEVPTEWMAHQTRPPTSRSVDLQGKKICQVDQNGAKNTLKPGDSKWPFLA